MGRPRAPGTNLADYGDLSEPQDAQEPILSRPVREALLEWLTELWASDVLAEVGLKPRQRALFHGPPGTGKTTLAHHLAARLGLPMLLVRPDRVIGMFMGQTGQNLGGLFDAARPEPHGQRPVVLFLDEFEAIGSTRAGGGSGADQERTASLDTLLQRLDAHDGIVIAATNMARDIDPAIWRRFDLHIEVALPGPTERRHILARYLAPYRLPVVALDRLADATNSASPALLRGLCEGLKRSAVLAPRLNWPADRESTFERVLTSIEPHPSLGRPRLWALGATDAAVRALPWPLSREAPEDTAPPAPEPSDAVIPMRKHPG